MHIDPFFLKNIQSSPKKNDHGSAPVPSDTLSNKLTIITPCCRQNNIPMLYASIQFDKIDKWIIVYDTSRDRRYTRLYDGHPQIVEVEYGGVGSAGHPQRNYGMTLVDDGFIYFLDDDNIVHPDFWSIVDQLNCKYFYTFDQLRGHSILYGDTIQVGRIDTAMFIVHKQHINNITWITSRYDADGVFISDIASQNYGAHVYLNKVGCYYNFIRPT